jgi:hypothetical protein
MNKSIIWLSLIAVLALTLTAATAVSADSGDPTPQPRNCGLLDNLFKRDGCGTRMDPSLRADDGVLHDYMLQVFSDKLGIPETEIESRLNAGETMSQIALSEGLTLEEFQTWMLDARSQAIDQAVTDGKLTTEQAEWMKSHRAVMFGGFGEFGRSGGMMSGRHGRFGGMMFGGLNRPDSADSEGYPDCPNMP